MRRSNSNSPGNPCSQCCKRKEKAAVGEGFAEKEGFKHERVTEMVIEN